MKSFLTTEFMMDENDLHRELATSMRFYGDLRFKQLTLFVTILGISAAGVSQYEEKYITDSMPVRLAIACVMMMFTAVTWIMEVRSTMHWRAFKNAAPKELWPHHNSKCFNWLSSTNAVWFFLMSVYSFWLYCAVTWNLVCPILMLFVLLLIVLVVFTIYEYFC